MGWKTIHCEHSLATQLTLAILTLIRPWLLPSNPFKFFIHILPFYSTLYSLSCFWKSVVKYTINKIYNTNTFLLEKVEERDFPTCGNESRALIHTTRFTYINLLIILDLVCVKILRKVQQHSSLKTTWISFVYVQLADNFLFVIKPDMSSNL